MFLDYIGMFAVKRVGNTAVLYKGRAVDD